jgi:hypothetical protein
LNNVYVYFSSQYTGVGDAILKYEICSGGTGPGTGKFCATDAYYESNPGLLPGAYTWSTTSFEGVISALGVGGNSDDMRGYGIQSVMSSSRLYMYLISLCIM